MRNTHLNNSQTCATMNEATAAYAELLQRIERLEKIIMKQRETALMEIGIVENAFGIERTKTPRWQEREKNR